MSTVHDGSHGSSSSEDHSSRDGIHKDPNRVAGSLKAADCAIQGLFRVRPRQVQTEKGLLQWDEIRADDLNLPRREALLFLQGIGLQPWLNRLMSIQVGDRDFLPPFRAVSCNPINVHGRVDRMVIAINLMQVVLASDLHPGPMTEIEVLGCLLKGRDAP